MLQLGKPRTQVSKMLTFKQYLSEAQRESGEDSAKGGPSDTDTLKRVKGKKKVDHGTKADMKNAESSEKKLELMTGKVNKVNMEPKLDQNVNLTGRPK